MIGHIVYNKDFEEYVSSVNPCLETSEFEHEAFIFDNEEKAEEVRKQVQENTGNRWRVMDVEV